MDTRRITLTILAVWCASIGAGAQSVPPATPRVIEERSIADIIEDEGELALPDAKQPPAPTSPPDIDAQAIVTTAQSYLGVPYGWGGDDGSEFDCSGLVWRVFLEHGYLLPRVSREQANVGQRVRRADVRAGDLLFFAWRGTTIDHVGIYAGDDRFIHAASGRGEVTYDRLSTGYYARRYVTARRVLTLPKGSYTTARGTARPGAIAANATEAAEMTPWAIPATASRSGIAGGRPGFAPPTLLSSGLWRDAQNHVGPVAFVAPTTGFSLRAGVSHLQRRTSLVATPEIAYFSHRLGLSAAATLPLEVPLIESDEGTSRLWRQRWTGARDSAQLIRHVTLSRNEPALFVDLSRSASATLRHGHIMRYYTPGIDDASVPAYAIAGDPLSLSFGSDFDLFGLEILVDDVIRPNVVGASVHGAFGKLTGIATPAIKSLRVGLTYATDLRPPFETAAEITTAEALHAAGLDIETHPVTGRAFDMRAYATLSTLRHTHHSSAGGSLGTELRAKLRARRHHLVRLRLEAMLSGAGFEPSYFDAFYSVERYATQHDRPKTDPVPKLTMLAERAASDPSMRLHAELSYQLHRRITLVGLYEHGWIAPWAADHSRAPDLAAYGHRNAMLLLSLGGINLFGGTRRLCMHAAYHLRRFKRFGRVLRRRRHNEYLFVSFFAEAGRNVAVGATLRKRVSGDSNSASAHDGVVHIVLRVDV